MWVTDDIDGKALEREYLENELLFFFFFQAEDGIRDWSVTGVQTCALPIWPLQKRQRLFRKSIQTTGWLV